MVKGFDKRVVLRLICLLSITLSGLKKDELDILRKAYVTCYGWDEMVTLMNLQDAGILRVRDDNFSFGKVKKTMQLICEDMDERNPVDISFVYSGLAPVTVRLVEGLMSERGIRNISHYIKALNIPVTAPSESEVEFYTSKKGPMGIHRRKVLVYFLGGATYAEISAVRFLNTLFTDKQFIIATTCIISPNKVLK